MLNYDQFGTPEIRGQGTYDLNGEKIELTIQATSPSSEGDPFVENEVFKFRGEGDVREPSWQKQ